jgi:class 3 adenylate cyclase
LDKKLLVSASLVELLQLGSEYRVERLGPVELRGKDEPIELCSVERIAGP